jgi:dolichol kinase
VASELRRRAVHAAGTGLPALYLLGWVDYRTFRILLVVGVVAVFTLEFLRLVVGVTHWIYEELTREYEADNVAGYALYFVGAAVAGLLFPPAIGVPSFLMLSIGDPISGILGSADAGTTKAAGVLAVMFGVCFALAVPFTVPLLGRWPGVAVAAAGALGATAADGLKPVIAGYVIDDNLTIPPAAGAGMWAAMRLLG